MVLAASGGDAPMKGIDLRVVKSVSEAVAKVIPRGAEA
jgi:hypothetical protein